MAKMKVNKGANIRPGTVEDEARKHFEREKAAYEERTGEKCNYYLPAPLYSTPLPEVSGESIESVESVESIGSAESGAEGDAQGDE